MLVFDHRLTHLLRGLNGGYKYKRKQNGTYEDAPLKDEFSHDSDALQYLCLGAEMDGGAYTMYNQRREVQRVSSMGWT